GNSSRTVSVGSEWTRTLGVDEVGLSMSGVGVKDGQSHLFELGADPFHTVNEHSNPLSLLFFFSGRRRHTRSKRDWSSDVCSSDLVYSTETRIVSMHAAHTDTIAVYIG